MRAVDGLILWILVGKMVVEYQPSVNQKEHHTKETKKKQLTGPKSHQVSVFPPPLGFAILCFWLPVFVVLMGLGGTQEDGGCRGE